MELLHTYKHPTSIQHQDNEWTSIRIHRSTLELLGGYGKFKESWDDLIQRLLREKSGLDTNPEEGHF
jgi:hypothetical protein